MALSGIVWVGFIAIHMYGNTHAFQGRDEFNHYAHFLRTMGEPIFGYGQLLFLARVVVQANYAVRFIRLGGVVLAFFLLYHLAHFTWGVPLVHPTFVREDPYGNLIAGFQFFPNVLLYLVALVALGAHLFHGVWSMFQTLGVNSREYDGTIRAFAIALAVIIPAGFSLVPISVMLGILK
jgi:succinate dehydrogenase / fumarate reductase cytochrome b subunit